MTDIHGNISVYKPLNGQVSNGAQPIAGNIEVESEPPITDDKSVGIRGKVKMHNKIGGALKNTSSINGSINPNAKNRTDGDLKINGVVLVGDRSFEELGRDDISNSRIKEIVDSQYELIFGG